MRTVPHCIPSVTSPRACSVHRGIDTDVAPIHYGNMKYVSVNDTKNHISRLLRRVAAGEEIVIARRGVPIAKLIALPPSEQRRVGLDTGRFTVPADFNRPSDEDGKDHTDP